jgi:hypothetical protein
LEFGRNGGYWILPVNGASCSRRMPSVRVWSRGVGGSGSAGGG